jgi:ABC-type Fe3+-hydroxamate transport system substrate-binding protein
MYYNEKTGNFALAQPNLTESIVDEVTHEITETIVGLDPDYVLIADKPSEDYIYDGSKWVAKVIVLPTDSELKAIGLPYTLNGVEYQVPLDSDAQSIITALTVGYITATITNTVTAITISTVIQFSNGTHMPITTPDFIAFATWFKDKRSSFFAIS